MKNRKTISLLLILIAAFMMLGASTVLAYASGGGENPPPEETTPTSTPESTPPPNPVALAPDGNLTLVDDIQGEQAGDKQFMTVITKNGEYFYIIIDRAGNTENVYFLNMVDEADLFALTTDMDVVPQQPTPAPQPEPKPEINPTSQPEPQPEEKKGTTGGILLIAFILAAGGGAYYYFKIHKPKQGIKGGTDLAELDELEFEDDFISMDETCSSDEK